MACLYFYKLVSEYPCDVTKNCNLTTADIDSNFYQLKGDDIASASYNMDSMVISLNLNNGEKIDIDLSELGEDINKRIENAVSGITPSSGCCDIDLYGEYNEDGSVTLHWTSPDGEKTTDITGFPTEFEIRHDETISGDGSKTNPIRISNVEKTGKYKAVLGIVDNLPSDNVVIGDRYVTKEIVSKFGRLYNEAGLYRIKDMLEANGSLWRIPTKADWDKLLDYAEACDDTHDGDSVGEYVGDIAGRVLKSVEYWEGNPNLDTYGFSIFPSGYVSDDYLVGVDREARMWTDTNVDDGKYIKGFSYDHNNVLQDVSKEGEMYSIRLVMDIDINHPVSDEVNILGNKYNVINFIDINQAWIDVNLVCNPGNEFGDQYQYDHPNISSDKYVLNHWNGIYWEKKELNEGDEISVAGNNDVISYVCIVDENGSQQLVKGSEYKIVNGNRRMVIDAGWY